MGRPNWENRTKEDFDALRNDMQSGRRRRCSMELRIQAMTKKEAKELIARYTDAIPSDNSVKLLMTWPRAKFNNLPTNEWAQLKLHEIVFGTDGRFHKTNYPIRDDEEGDREAKE